MKINELKATTYKLENGVLTVSFDESFDKVFAVADGTISVATDAGSIVEVFSGYVKRRIIMDVSTGYVNAEFVMMDSDIAEAVNALANQVSTVANQSTSGIDEIKAQNDEIMLAIAELGTMVTGA